MQEKKYQTPAQDELLKEYNAQIEDSENTIHTHVDYSDSYSEGCC